MLEKYGVNYVYVSDYERADFLVDLEGIEKLGELVYENPDVRIYAIPQEKTGL